MNKIPLPSLCMCLMSMASKNGNSVVQFENITDRQYMENIKNRSGYVDKMKFLEGKCTFIEMFLNSLK